MKNTRKLMALLLAAVMVLALTACGSKEAVPDVTSENAGLYVSTDGTSVVDRTNRVASNYSVDKNGNIVNVNGNVSVAAKNTSVYEPITGLSVANTNNIAFPVRLLSNALGEAQPASIELKVTISPLTATCKEINVSSSNPGVADTPYSAYTVGLGSDSVAIPVTLKAAGTATLTFKSPADTGEQHVVTMEVSAAAGEGGLSVNTTVGNNNTTTNPDNSTVNTSDPNNATNNTTTGTNNNTTPDPTPEGTGRTGYVIGAGVNFRDKASTDSNVIDTLAYGTEITIYSITNGWANVVYGGRTGYMSANLVSYTKPDDRPAGTGRSGYVIGDGVNFRTSASTNSDVIDTLAYGTQITIYNVSNGWAQVGYGGRVGYMSANLVSYDQPTDDPYVDGGSSSGGSSNNNGSGIAGKDIYDD